MDDDRILLSAGTSSHFKKLRTVPIFSLHLLISTTISIVGIVLAATWPESKRCEAYYILLYLRCGFWVLTWMFDFFVHHHHNQLKNNGYHDFYRATNTHKAIPLQIVSLWNTALLAVAAGLHHYYGEGFLQKCLEAVYNPALYVTAFSVAETLLFFFIHGSYINKVMNFNNSKMPPDALQGINTSSVSGSVGLMQRGADVTELLEKQALLIEFLHQKQQSLNQKIMQMSNQLRTVTLGPQPTI